LGIPSLGEYRGIKMAQLTQQELEKEVNNFKEYLTNPVPTGIVDYKNNEFVSKLLDQNVDFVVSALTAWLIRAEMEKGGNKP
jgi:hypothetical protein